MRRSTDYILGVGWALVIVGTTLAIVVGHPGPESARTG